MATGYVYSPLRADLNEIRVLILDSVNDSLRGIISGTMEAISLKASSDDSSTSIGDYETISYVWGDATIRAEINIDG